MRYIGGSGEGEGGGEGVGGDEGGGGGSAGGYGGYGGFGGFGGGGGGEGGGELSGHSGRHRSAQWKGQHSEERMAHRTAEHVGSYMHTYDSRSTSPSGACEWQ